MSGSSSLSLDDAGRHPLLVRLRRIRERSAVRRFVSALLVPWWAMRFIVRQRRLWPLIVVPALVNTVLFVVAAMLLIAHADDWLGAWWAKPEAAAWLDWMLVAAWYLAWGVAIVLGLVLSYVLVLLLGGIVASPFNDVLSERTEQLLTGRPEVPQPGDTFVGGIVASIRSTVVITGLYLVLMVPVLLLGLVPGLGSLAATVVSGLVGAFFLALEYADTVLARYGLRLREKLRLLRGHLALSIGFGLGASLLLWVPFLNFLCIPITVVGGTILALGLIDTP